MALATDVISKTREKTVDILGVPVNRLTMEELLWLAEQCISYCQPLLLGVVRCVDPLSPI